MPVEKVKDPKTGRQKFRWGKTGKLYTRRIDAVKQGVAHAVVSAGNTGVLMAIRGDLNANGTALVLGELGLALGTKTVSKKLEK